MIHVLFGNYLKKIGKLSADQLAKVYDEQKKVRVKLGLIAVAEKMMTNQQAEEVNKLQSVLDKRFGDIAVEKGYLTDEQVGRLLGMQGNLYLSFAQAVTNEEFMTMAELEEAFLGFQKELGFTQSDMDRLKSGEADLIIPLFLPLEMDEYQKNNILIGVKTLMRLIDNDLYIDKATWESEVSCDAYAKQDIFGDTEASFVLGSESDSLLKIAIPFAEEEFEKLNLDALDAVAEFINCINGMFASESSPKFNVDMLPPSYEEGKHVMKADHFCRLPVYIHGERVELLSAFNEKIVVEGE